MTEGWNNGTTEGQGESSIAPLFQSVAIINKIFPVKIFIFTTKKFSVCCIGMFS